MNLMRIKYFVEVARCGSFSKAAQTLYVSQPNLSRQVALMEQEVGFELFRRSGKNIHLTHAGEYLYTQFREILAMTEQAIAHAEAISRHDGERLSIGVLDGQEMGQFMSQRVRELQERRPNLDIRIERNSFRSLRQGLDRGEYDVILTMDFELGGHPEWDSRVLIKQHGAMVISCRHPLAERTELAMTDFRDEPFVVISREESPGGYELLIRQCARCGFTPRIVRETSNTENTFLCVELGVGVAMLDRNTRLEQNSNLRVISMPDSLGTSLVAVWHRDNHNPMVSAFVEAFTGES